VTARGTVVLWSVAAAVAAYLWLTHAPARHDAEPARALGHAAVDEPQARGEIGVVALCVPGEEEAGSLHDQRAIGRLRFIRHARELGFEIEAIRQLLRLADRPDDPAQTVLGMGLRHRRRSRPCRGGQPL